MKMYFQNANSSTENFPATLPEKLPSSDINSQQKRDKSTPPRKAMGKE